MPRVGRGRGRVSPGGAAPSLPARAGDNREQLVPEHSSHPRLRKAPVFARPFLSSVLWVLTEELPALLINTCPEQRPPAPHRRDFIGLNKDPQVTEQEISVHLKKVSELRKQVKPSPSTARSQASPIESKARRIPALRSPLEQLQRRGQMRRSVAGKGKGVQPRLPACAAVSAAEGSGCSSELMKKVQPVTVMGTG